MAEPFTIPKFREKIIYWTTNAGTSISYPVSSSYRGILRLSPNDDLTLQEKEPIKLYDDQIENFYRDCIDPAITQQFIRVSTSDGYFVGMRLNQYELEVDELYVIGPAKFDMVRLFTKRNNGIKLKNNTALPGRVNRIMTALIDSASMITKDLSGVNTHSELDQSYTLISRDLDEREFEYQQTTQLIRELVIESLLDLQTLPTGSIHYTPMTIKKYEALLSKGKPNQYFMNDGQLVNDPIVRDFLLCDGSLYKNDQFPELAKILENERIEYWRYDSGKNRMIQMTYVNDYTKNKWFRVPDLRARFIKSVYLDRNLASNETNVTGKYSCDCRPTNSAGAVDNHVHFITTAFYQQDPQLRSFTTVANIIKKQGLRDKWQMTQTPGVLHPHNKQDESLYQPTFAYGSLKSGYWSHYGDWGYWQKISWNRHAYFLSIPEEYDYQNPNCIPNVGLSSDDMPSCKETPSNDQEISYNNRTDFTPFVGTTAASTYGMENDPEFFCMIPLIKI